MKSIIKYLEYIIYWSMVVIPFSIAVAPAPTNIFMGFMITSFLAKKILKKEPLTVKTSINTPLIFLFIITCISIINSVNYFDSFKGGILRLLQYIFVFFIMVEELKDQKHIATVILSIGMGITLVSIDGIWQVARGRDFIRGYSPLINLDIVRATASFKDANLLGIYLSAFSPLIFGLTFYYFKNKKRLVFIFVSLLALIGILLTYSRPTFLAIYVVLFFFSIVRRDRILMGFLIIFTLISPFIVPRSVKEWVRQVDYNPIRFMCNDDRIAIYRNSLNMIKHHPIIGVGANTFMKNYKQYKESPEYRNIVTSDYIYAHNNFLHLAAEIGLIGLAIFIWLLCKLFIELKYIYRLLREPYLKVISLSLSACLIAFLINGLTESSLFYSRVALIFWYMAGFALSLKKIASR